MADNEHGGAGAAPLLERIDLFQGPNPFLAHGAVMATLAIDRFGGGDPRPLPGSALVLLREILLTRCRASAALDLAPDSARLLSGSQPAAIAATVGVVCLELQRLNTNLADGLRIIAEAGRPQARVIAYGYESTALGRAAAPAACDLVDAVLRAPDGAVAPGDFPLPASLKAFLASARSAPILRSSRKLLRNVEARGIPWMQVRESSDLLQLGHGCRRRLVRGSTSDATSQIGHWLSSNKLLCSAFLGSLGLPVPRQIEVASADQAVAAARAIGYPVVVKPLAGFNGRGITVGVRRDADIPAAFRLAATLQRGVMVENVIAGDCHRLIVVNGTFVAASRFDPASVVGDGASDIATLVARENARPVRGQGFASGLLPIPMDDVTDGVLAANGLTVRSVPAAGERVRLRNTANLSTGGVRTVVTDQMHPDIARMTEQIARAAGIDIAGIDFITPDLGRSFREVPCGVIEINTNPGIGYGDPDAGLPDETIAILDMLYPPGAPATIPIVHVHGRETADAVAHALADRLAPAMAPVGCASGRGLQVDGLLLHGRPLIGDITAGRALLCNPTVASAVMAVRPETVQRRGIGSDHADVAVVLDDARASLTVAARITRGMLVVPAAMARDLPDASAGMEERLVAVGDPRAAVARRVWRDGADGPVIAACGEQRQRLDAAAGEAALYAAAADWALHGAGAA